jgi:hypothetical protein
VVTEFLSTRPLDADGWREAHNPAPLLDHLKKQQAPGGRAGLLNVDPGRRKARHFAAGCCRRVGHLVRFPELSALVTRVEDYAEGRIRVGELLAEKRLAEATVGPEGTAEPWQLSDRLAREAHRLAHRLTTEFAPHWTTPADRLAHGAYLQAAVGNSAQAIDCWERAAEAAANAGADLAAEMAFQSDLLRDLFGNPFRPVAFDPAWRTAAVLALAGSADESGDYGALPILADALQEAGCEDAEVLTHCRAAPVHARGCWVVDAALGLLGNPSPGPSPKR